MFTLGMFLRRATPPDRGIHESIDRIRFCIGPAWCIRGSGRRSDHSCRAWPSLGRPLLGPSLSPLRRLGLASPRPLLSPLGLIVSVLAGIRQEIEARARNRPRLFVLT